MPAQILQARRRILVVEDEPGIADTICYALSTDGFDPHVCALGGEALAALETGEFALAILDVGLPDVNGFELFRQIRAIEPVVQTSGHREQVARRVACLEQVVMALDGRVRVESVSATVMGAPFTGHGMLGYDNVTGKYWSTWNDSTSTGLMVSEGTCDARKACTFTGSWNDPVRKGPVTARMTTRWTNPTTEVFELYGPGKDGKEMKMMEMTYTKK